MPVELSDLLGNERWVTVEVSEGVSFRVAYRPGATSLLQQAEMQKLLRELKDAANLDEVEQARIMADTFCQMVCAWDLADKGVLLPVTPETALRLPGAIFNAVMDAVGSDGQRQQEEKKQSSATLDDGLPAAGKWATVQNGTHQSERRATWA